MSRMDGWGRELREGAEARASEPAGGDAAGEAAAAAAPDASGPSALRGGNAQGARIVRARKVTAALVFAAVIASLVFDSGIGTPSTFGAGPFFLLCPLGGLEAMLAERTFLPIAAISMLVVLAFAAIAGRAWCAWGCPAPIIRNFFRGSGGTRTASGSGQGSKPVPCAGPSPSRSPEPRSLDAGGTGTASGSGHGAKPAPSAGPSPSRSPEPRSLDAGGTGTASGSDAASHSCIAQAWSLRGALAYVGRDSRTWVLGGVLLVALVAGLPLFCLVCPIGLSFGTVASLWNLFVHKQVTLSCVVFPAALLVELVLCRTWCVNVCPVAGLLGIAGQFARVGRPRIGGDACLQAKGGSCDVCTRVCPERIDKHAPDAAFQLGACTRCGECARSCPTASIELSARER